jgi:hypothetical protein
MLVGGALLTSMAVLSCSAVVKITTENFTATSAFTPVATLLVQSGASELGLIPGYALDRSLLPAMVVFGVPLIFAAAAALSNDVCLLPRPLPWSQSWPRLLLLAPQNRRARPEHGKRSRSGNLVTRQPRYVQKYGPRCHTLAQATSVGQP